ncbi:hypothetical protein ATK36_0709 [Amycolatopsis sulphurea]|uniref:Uncharacterized protein n=1 Tax=Amycolatopsis sulphurea TaxID=76022 RepID=A0A2A9G324_9PSEU|nr:hypothetical protein ATK36_0709 [Amycolatopsis sulphurea]
MTKREVAHGWVISFVAASRFYPRPSTVADQE